MGLKRFCNIHEMARTSSSKAIVYKISFVTLDDRNVYSFTNKDEEEIASITQYRSSAPTAPIVKFSGLPITIETKGSSRGVYAIKFRGLDPVSLDQWLVAETDGWGPVFPHSWFSESDG